MRKHIFCLGILFALAVHPALAQMARYYNVFNLAEGTANDLTATLPAGTTNQILLLSGTVTNQVGSPTSITTITGSNIVVNCSEFNSAGFTFQSTGVAGSTNATFGVLIYGSASRGAVWDASARWTFTTTNVAPGTQTYTVVTNLDLTGLDRLAFVFLNGLNTVNGLTNSYQTNVIAGVRLKGAKAMTRPSAD